MSFMSDITSSSIFPSDFIRQTTNDLPQEFFKQSQINNNCSNKCSSSTATNPTEDNSSNKPLSLMELVHSITAEFSKGSPDLKKVRAYMENYDSSLYEYKRYAFFDQARKYTRNLIATDNTHFTLMLLCWNASQGSPIHNHSGSECFMRVVEGKLLESQYFMPEATENGTSFQSKPECCSGTDSSSNEHCTLKLKEKNCLSPGNVAYINDNIGLHKVENIYPAPAITLHLYMPPYDQCKCYAEDTGHVCEAFTTFYSEHGEKVSPT